MYERWEEDRVPVSECIKMSFFYTKPWDLCHLQCSTTTNTSETDQTSDVMTAFESAVKVPLYQTPSQFDKCVVLNFNRTSCDILQSGTSAKDVKPKVSEQLPRKVSWSGLKGEKSAEWKVCFFRCKNWFDINPTCWGVRRTRRCGPGRSLRRCSVMRSGAPVKRDRS